MTNFNRDKAEKMLRSVPKDKLVDLLAKFMFLATNKQKPDSPTDAYCFGWNASRDTLKDVVCEESYLLRYIYSCCNE